MAYTHTVPLTHNIAYILAQPEVPKANSYGSTTTPEGYVFSYEGTQADYDAVIAMLADYPVRYANHCKPDRWLQVRARRDIRENLPAPTPVGPVDSTDVSKIKILGVVAMANLAITKELIAASVGTRAFNPANVVFSERFTLANNTYVTLTFTTAIAMAEAAGKYVSDVHDHARTLRDLIRDAADITELDAIDLVDGWPEAGIEPPATA